MKKGAKGREKEESSGADDANPSDSTISGDRASPLDTRILRGGLGQLRVRSAGRRTHRPKSLQSISLSESARLPSSDRIPSSRGTPDGSAQKEYRPSVVMKPRRGKRSSRGDAGEQDDEVGFEEDALDLRSPLRSPPLSPVRSGSTRTGVLSQREGRSSADLNGRSSDEALDTRFSADALDSIRETFARSSASWSTGEAAAHWAALAELTAAVERGRKGFSIPKRWEAFAVFGQLTSSGNPFETWESSLGMQKGSMGRLFLEASQPARVPAPLPREKPSLERAQADERRPDAGLRAGSDSRLPPRRARAVAAESLELQQTLQFDEFGAIRDALPPTTPVVRQPRPSAPPEPPLQRRRGPSKARGDKSPPPGRPRKMKTATFFYTVEGDDQARDDDAPVSGPADLGDDIGAAVEVPDKDLPGGRGDNGDSSESISSDDDESESSSSSGSSRPSPVPSSASRSNTTSQSSRHRRSARGHHYHLPSDLPRPVYGKSLPADWREVRVLEEAGMAASDDAMLNTIAFRAILESGLGDFSLKKAWKRDLTATAEVDPGPPGAHSNPPSRRAEKLHWLRRAPVRLPGDLGPMTAWLALMYGDVGVQLDVRGATLHSSVYGMPIGVFGPKAGRGPHVVYTAARQMSTRRATDIACHRAVSAMARAGLSLERHRAPQAIGSIVPFAQHSAAMGVEAAALPAYVFELLLAIHMLDQAQVEAEFFAAVHAAAPPGAVFCADAHKRIRAAAHVWRIVGLLRGASYNVVPRKVLDVYVGTSVSSWCGLEEVTFSALFEPSSSRNSHSGGNGGDGHMPHFPSGGNGGAGGGGGNGGKGGKGGRKGRKKAKGKGDKDSPASGPPGADAGSKGHIQSQPQAGLSVGRVPSAQRERRGRGNVGEASGHVRMPQMDPIDTSASDVAIRAILDRAASSRLRPHRALIRGLQISEAGYDEEAPLADDPFAMAEVLPPPAVTAASIESNPEVPAWSLPEDAPVMQALVDRVAATALDEARPVPTLNFGVLRGLVMTYGARDQALAPRTALPRLLAAWEASGGVDLAQFCIQGVAELPVWSETTVDATALEAAAAAAGIPRRQGARPAPTGPLETDFEQDEELFLAGEVRVWHARQVIRLATESDTGIFVAPLRVARTSEWASPDPSESPLRVGDVNRLLLDLRGFNGFLVVAPFQLNAVDRAMNAAASASRGASMDFKSAFICVPLAPMSRIKLGFMWRGQLYVLQRMPFGLAVAPEIFVTISAAVVTATRGILASLAILVVLVIYIDDSGLLGSDRMDDALLVARAVAALVGLATPEAKLQRPSPTLDFLGFRIRMRSDTGPATICLLPAFAKKFASELGMLRDQLRTRGVTSREFVESVRGRAIWAATVHPPSRAFVRGFGAWLGHPSRSGTGLVQLAHPRGRADLHHWCGRLPYLEEELPIPVPSVEYTVVCDANGAPEGGATFGAIVYRRGVATRVVRGAINAQQHASSTMYEVVAAVATVVLATSPTWPILVVTDSQAGAAILLRGNAAEARTSAAVGRALAHAHPATLMATWGRRDALVAADAVARSADVAAALAQSYGVSLQTIWADAVDTLVALPPVVEAPSSKVGSRSSTARALRLQTSDASTSLHAAESAGGLVWMNGAKKPPQRVEETIVCRPARRRKTGRTKEGQPVSPEGSSADPERQRVPEPPYAASSTHDAAQDRVDAAEGVPPPSVVDLLVAGRRPDGRLLSTGVESMVAPTTLVVPGGVRDDPAFRMASPSVKKELTAAFQLRFRPRTWDRYVSKWRSLQAWCRKRDLESKRPSATAMARFLVERRDAYPGKLLASTVESWVTSLVSMYEVQFGPMDGHERKILSTLVSAMKERDRRDGRVAVLASRLAVGQRPPVTAFVLRRMARAIRARPDSRRRDKDMFLFFVALVMYNGLLRSGEALKGRLRVSDLRRLGNGNIAVYIRASKAARGVTTALLWQRNDAFLDVRERVLALCEHQRRLGRSVLFTRDNGRPISGSSLTKRIKVWAKWAEVEHPKLFGVHGLRRGAASDLRRAKLDDAILMRLGRWRNRQSLETYTAYAHDQAAYDVKDPDTL